MTSDDVSMRLAFLSIKWRTTQYILFDRSRVESVYDIGSVKWRDIRREEKGKQNKVQEEEENEEW